ncbi:hypothetical protein SKAU_G00088850 [Synaphobranchus kaupii]|uniref:Uncharacterized protein n=1 Tax=Synaphobranchus kaupii TaxID=118154 RepID=A0A9Q1FWP9_SYNKA|nr:hypothetical protein SKAU_G00088850 [Synaphobranchus kaupii]
MLSIRRQAGPWLGGVSAVSRRAGLSQSHTCIPNAVDARNAGLWTEAWQETQAERRFLLELNELLHV